MATDNQILKIKFEESGLTNITAKVEDLNGALTRLGKSKTAVVSGLTKEQAKNIEGISNVRETTPDKVLKQGARATSEEFKYSQKEAEKSLNRHQRAVDQIESRKEKRFKHTLKEQRGLMHDWLKGFGGVGDMRHYTGVSYKQPTGVSLFNDLSQMHPAIGGGMFNMKRMKQLSSITPKSPDSYLQSTYAPKEIKNKIVQESEQKKIFKMIQAQEEFNKREKVGMWNSSFIAPTDQYPEKKGWRNLQSKLDLEYQQQINQEQTINKQGKKSIESRKKEIDDLKKTSNRFKSLSTATLMLNMSFLGVYFSFMGLFNVMRSGIMSIFAPISDIGGTITGSALATAFLGKDKATGMGGSDVADLISSWKTLSGVQGEITTLISKLATSIFTDSGFQSSLFSILDSIKTFVTNPKLKDAFIGLFSMLADNMPEILDTLIEVVNLTKTLVDFVSKNPMILKAVLYSIVAMPFLSILNLIAGSVSALISLITGYIAWNKSIQMAQLVAQQTGAVTNLAGGATTLPLGVAAGAALTSVINPAAAFLGAIAITDIWNTISNKISEDIKNNPLLDLFTFQEGLTDGIMDIIGNAFNSLTESVGIDSTWFTDHVKLFYDKLFGFEKFGLLVPPFGVMSGVLNSATNGEGLGSMLTDAITSGLQIGWEQIGGGKQGNEKELLNKITINIDGQNVTAYTEGNVKSSTDAAVRYGNSIDFIKSMQARARGY